MRWSEFFSLTKSDRQVLLVLLTVASVALTVIFIAGGNDKPQTTLIAPSDSITPSVSANNPPPSPYYHQEERTVERFVFDPNTADSTQLLRLGLQSWQVRNIYKYRASGGVYRKKEDFARLYGLTVKQYHELEPYIQISSDYLPASTLVSPREEYSDTLRFTYQEKIAEGEHVDLNAADTSVYKTVPGIGSYYARQIADYGRRLGGYTTIDQLDEIDHFPVEAKAYFTVDVSRISHININQLSLNELKRHPYINFYQARAIVEHRRLFGPIQSLEDLHLLPEFPPEAIARLMPYVEF